jgi:hypothetical protein
MKISNYQPSKISQTQQKVTFAVKPIVNVGTLSIGHQRNFESGKKSVTETRAYSPLGVN